MSPPLTQQQRPPFNIDLNQVPSESPPLASSFEDRTTFIRISNPDTQLSRVHKKITVSLNVDSRIILNVNVMRQLFENTLLQGQPSCTQTQDRQEQENALTNIYRLLWLSLSERIFNYVKQAIQFINNNDDEEEEEDSVPLQPEQRYAFQTYISEVTMPLVIQLKEFIRDNKFQDAEILIHANVHTLYLSPRMTLIQFLSNDSIFVPTFRLQSCLSVSPWDIYQSSSSGGGDTNNVASLTLDFMTRQMSHFASLMNTTLYQMIDMTGSQQVGVGITTSGNNGNGIRIDRFYWPKIEIEHLVLLGSATNTTQLVPRLVQITSTDLVAHQRP
jgi:hypothetical protein